MADDKDTQRDTGGWKFNRTVSLGDILVAISLAVPAFIWGSSINRDVAVLQAQQQELRRDMEWREAQQDAAFSAASARIEKQLTEMNAALQTHANNHVSTR